MNSAVNIIIESGVSLSLLAIIYVFFLRKETFFKLNRIFLLGSVLFSVILPFLKFRVFAPKSVMLAEITVTPYRNMVESVTVYSHGFTGSVEQAILSTNLFTRSVASSLSTSSLFITCSTSNPSLKLKKLLKRMDASNLKKYPTKV